ncbi:hypothetical protein V1498_16350 [Peribacillus sp. SCS-26]|uniref:hypothetical protein n=1 Tax=Paraperibacillus marinus TaxID=3115295 RepID=UPI003905CBB7
MAAYLMDLILVSILVIGITAFIAVISNGIGEKLFSGNKKNEFTDKSASIQAGWKPVGGRKK